MIETVFRATRMGAATLLAVALALLLAGCGGGGGGQQEGEAPEEGAEQPVAGNFVGEVSDFEGDPEAVPFVAVVAAEAQEGAREVRAYLCDGQSINEWFTGTAEGDELDLTSEGGARLEGSLAPEAATGTITLEDGQSFEFTADLATGIAGLYNVNLSPDGVVAGTSEAGGSIEGQLADEPQLAPQRQLETYPVTGTITAPDGEERDFEHFFDSDEPGEARWIVLADGSAKGAKKTAATGSSGAGFSCPIMD